MTGDDGGGGGSFTHGVYGLTRWMRFLWADVTSFPVADTRMVSGWKYGRTRQAANVTLMEK